MKRKRIILHHSKHYESEGCTILYYCPHCKYDGIESNYKFCPICGKKIEFQECREYERELLCRIISRIKYRLGLIFMVVKNEDGTFSLLNKDGKEDKELAKKAKFVIETILKEFTNKKVFQPKKWYHPILQNSLDFNSTAKQVSNNIFSQFIQEQKENIK